MPLEDASIHAWIAKNGLVTETGKPYDLRNHLFWFDVLSDESPYQVWLKAAQVGGTVAAVVKLFWTMRRKGVNAIYTMPTDGDVRDFVAGKVNPLISANPALHSLITDKDSIEQKRVGKNTVYFRGTWTSRAALSVSSDLNVHDEEDRSNPDIVAQYASRLQHSEFRHEWHFSNPSSEGHGVDRYWKESDQKHWFVTCPACKAEQDLTWPDSIDPSRKAYVCKKCSEILPDEARRVGRWIAMAPKGKYSGYWISLLMATWVSAAEILEMRRTKGDEYFYNFVLGLPYAGAGSKLTEDEFFANLSADPYSTDGQICIGVDTGLPIWYAVGNSQGLFSAGSCDSYDELESMMRRWPRAVLVADQGGDLIGVRQLREKFPGRVYLCHYRTDRKTYNLISWGTGEESGNVVVDRNRAIQMLMDELRARAIPLRGSREDWQEAWTHFANAYRTLEEDAQGNPRFVWNRQGPDHLMHACTYWRVAMDRFGFRPETTFVAPPIELPGAQRGVWVGPVTGKNVMGPPVEQPGDWRDV